MKRKDLIMNGRFYGTLVSFGIAKIISGSYHEVCEFEIVASVGVGDDTTYWARTSYGFIVESVITDDNVQWEDFHGRMWASFDEVILAIEKDLFVMKTSATTINGEMLARAIKTKVDIFLAAFRQEMVTMIKKKIDDSSRLS